MEKEKKQLWAFPWGYAESLIIAAGLLLVGFFIEFFTHGRGVGAIQWPANIIIGIAIVAIIVSFHFIFRKDPSIKWLSSVPASISALILMTVVVMFMGAFKQNDAEASEWVRRFGLSHITSSWMYVITIIYLLLILGFVIMKRLQPMTWRNAGFLLSHAGLWLTIMAGTLGAGDLRRLHFFLYENKDFEWRAMDQEKNVYELPMAFRLLDFEITEFSPKIGIASHQTDQLIGEEGMNIFMIEEIPTQGQINEFSFVVDSMITNAHRNGAYFYSSDSVGHAPALHIVTTNTKTGEKHEGWITSGSMMMEPAFVRADTMHSFVMLYPEPKKFKSVVEKLTPDGVHDTITLEVNSAIMVNGWKIYQTSYDERMGKWSNLSILEAVRDPWLPAVYTGIFMLIAGAVWMFWLGKDIKDDEEEVENV